MEITTTIDPFALVATTSAALESGASNCGARLHRFHRWPGADPSVRLTGPPLAISTAGACYPHLARLCYKRCAVEPGVQRAGASDLRSESRKGLRGETCGNATESAGERGGTVPAEGSTASHLPVTVVREDASQFCPDWSQRLESRRCKLICNVCGYYMSCADYY